ncbi:MAG: phage tail assembly protein [Oculatellaceae cyanobacterium Prado106]|jgi:hypothetical protein|nr:phage tail assembly protein [Oculatellaceae cyanobacterium Prado106]
MSSISATEFEFKLPRGLVDPDGAIHQAGRMRLATAKDEMLVQKNYQAQDNETYGTLVMLSQVITTLGTLKELTPELLENLFSLDLAYLQEFYNRINQSGQAHVPVQCPTCRQQFAVEFALSGE